MQKMSPRLLLLSLVSFLILNCVVAMPGAPKPGGEDDPEIQNALKFAIVELNAMSNNYWKYMAIKVRAASKQVVAGMKYCIVTTVGSSACRNDEKHKNAGLDLCPVNHAEMLCKFEVYTSLTNTSKLTKHICGDIESTSVSDQEFTCTSGTGNKRARRSIEDNEIDEEEDLKKHVAKLYGQDELDLFEGFIQKYNKKYKDSTEHKKRFTIFQKNLVKARKIQETDQGTAKYGITQFSDLTYEEFKELYLMPEWHKPSYEMPQADTPVGDTPKEFDWRDHGAVTPVKNQGQCGSCWAFSTTGNIEGQWAIKKGKLISLSEQELVDCDTVDSGCAGGLPATAYKQIMKIGGLETETDYPYEGRGENCQFQKDKVKVYINSSVAISSDEKKMASWLASNGPISIGINAAAMQFYMGGIAHPWKIFCNPSKLDHGVLIVGYGVKGLTPYWIVKNSWGRYWGVQGYYLVYRGAGVCGLNTACTSAVVD